MRLPDEQDEPLQINIVPMIDVIFAILTFFIVSTLFLTRSEGIPVNLPTAASATAQTQQQVIVSINRQGQIFVRETQVDLATLEAQVRSLVQAGITPKVIINADQETPHGRVVAVMDRLRLVEGAELAIGTQPPSP